MSSSCIRIYIELCEIDSIENRSNVYHIIQIIIESNVLEQQLRIFESLQSLTFRRSVNDTEPKRISIYSKYWNIIVLAQFLFKIYIPNLIAREIKQFNIIQSIRLFAHF